MRFEGSAPVGNSLRLPGYRHFSGRLMVGAGTENTVGQPVGLDELPNILHRIGSGERDGGAMMVRLAEARRFFERCQSGSIHRNDVLSVRRSSLRDLCKDAGLSPRCFGTAIQERRPCPRAGRWSQKIVRWSLGARSLLSPSQRDLIFLTHAGLVTKRSGFRRAISSSIGGNFFKFADLFRLARSVEVVPTAYSNPLPPIRG